MIFRARNSIGFANQPQLLEAWQESLFLLTPEQTLNYFGASISPYFNDQREDKPRQISVK
jgi:hypothetical protein